MTLFFRYSEYIAYVTFAFGYAQLGSIIIYLAATMPLRRWYGLFLVTGRNLWWRWRSSWWLCWWWWLLYGGYHCDSDDYHGGDDDDDDADADGDGDDGDDDDDDDGDDDDDDDVWF